MQNLIALYKILTLIYSLIVMVCWIERLGAYSVYKNIKFKHLFKVYDLGVIIFPLSILIIGLIFIIVFIDEGLRKISINGFFNKNLFK